MAIIQFKISKTGEVALEVSGATGASCEQITRAFEDALGVKTDIQYKPDFFVQLDDIQSKIYEGEE